MSLKEEDDYSLLKSIQQGRHDAFAIVVERYHRRFYAVAYRFLGDRHEAEDIVQDAFLKLWTDPDKWNSTKNVKFTTWFYRLVINLCLDRRKRKAPVPLGEDEDFADTRINQEALLASKQSQQLLEDAICALPERQRIALNLCFYEELSNQDAADVMGVNIKALQSLLIRAKTALKEKFTRYV